MNVGWKITLLLLTFVIYMNVSLKQYGRAVAWALIGAFALAMYIISIP